MKKTCVRQSAILKFWNKPLRTAKTGIKAAAKADRHTTREDTMRHAKSFDTYPRSDLIELSRKGGKASGKARRKKRAAIEKQKLKDKAYQEEKRENLSILSAAGAELARAARAKQEAYAERVKLEEKYVDLLYQKKRRHDSFY